MVVSRINRKWRVVIRWACWIVVIQIILINLCASLYAYRLTRFYDDPSLLESNPKRNVFSKTWRLFTGPRYPRSQIIDQPVFPFEVITLKVKDGNSIEAWYSKADSLNKGTVILYHGMGIAKDQLLYEAMVFRNMGYHIMLVDFRGHGNSSGNTTTIGVNESEEVKLTTEHIMMLGEKRIFLWGASMGAVAIVKAIGEYQLKVSGIILEVPFSSIQSHLEARARILGFPGQPFAFLTTFWIGVERGFNGFGSRTVKYAKKVHCPVLVQWGSNDPYVLQWEMDSVFGAIASSDKQLVIYENAFHESLLRRDAGKWKKEVGTFLETKL